MTLDLKPLEQAAARVGLPGLKARVVPHDRRRGWWFRWRDGELLVDERVLDHCAPADASALLMGEVLQKRSRRRAALQSLPVFALGLALCAAPFAFLIGMSILLLGCVLLGLLRGLAVHRADDETVNLIGDATPLVRGLNEMDFEEIHLAGRILPARPDLHRRAERLVRLHGLCEAQPPT
ncbi:MAG TPA: hypothetical protein VFY71_03545 [Planctomycetota bacterium]|nr:hypothetical protein [Planctomycetota bacterium]